jgi:hypothetical protein
MVSKRKRVLEDFDPNKSDSEDENFDPSEVRAPRSSKKARPSRGSRPAGGRKRGVRYRGSDIDDDDEILSDSMAEGSFEDGSEEDEDAPVNAAGRRTRKAARTHHSYRESSADGEDDDVVGDSDNAGNDDEESSKEEPAGRRLVKLKVPKGSSEGITRRATRASTADAEEFVELSNSGRHAVVSRDSRSRSPEAYSRTRRSSRSMKGLQNAPETIEEATQESSNRAALEADEPDELSHDYKPTEKKEVDDEDMADVTATATVEDIAAAEHIATAEDIAAETAKEPEVVAEPAADQDDEDEDDVPVTRQQCRRRREGGSDRRGQQHLAAPDTWPL